VDCVTSALLKCDSRCMKVTVVLLCRRDDSSDSEHGGRHRHTRTSPSGLGPTSSSSSRLRQQGMTARNTRSPVVDMTARQSAAVGGQQPQYTRDDSVDSSMSAGTRFTSRCMTSPYTIVAAPYLRTVHRMYRQRPTPDGLTLRLAPETCV